MPIYSYKCEECGTKYEVFHKSKEDERAIICPSCNSQAYRKVMSSTNIGNSSSFSNPLPTCPATGGGCQGGMCGLN